MLSLLAQMTILLTGETGGVSGRQVSPILPTLSGIQIQEMGYRAVTHAGRACFPKDLGSFEQFLTRRVKRKLENKTKLLRWRQSWFVTDHVKPELLDRLGAKDLTSHDAQWEVWSVGNQVLRCVAVGDAIENAKLANNLGLWEIRWSAQTELPRIGLFIEIARPLGDGSRRLHQIRKLREQRPDLLWFDLGSLLEGRSIIRDGLDLQRTLTVQELHSVPPQLLLPSPQDLAAGMDHLLQELRPGGTQILQTSKAPPAPGRVRSWRHTQDGQRILVLGLGDAPEEVGVKQAIEEILTQAESDEWVILLSRQTTHLHPWIHDPRIAMIAVPGSLRLGPFKGSWQRGHASSGGPLLMQVAPNRLLTVTLGEKGKLEFVSNAIDERIPADPKLARQVNLIRHTLYPDLNRTAIPAGKIGSGTHLKGSRTGVLLAHTILRAADADAVLLPPLEDDRPLPGPLSRMRLRSQLRIPGYLVRRRVEGRDLLKAAAAFGNAQLTSREKITAEAPVMLVTTADLANQLAKALGPKAGTYALQLKDGHLIPLPSTSSQLPTSLRDLGVTLIEGQLLWDRPDLSTLERRVAMLLEPPKPRSAFRFRIDRLSLSIQEVSLRAPAERRAPEDPRANSPTRLSVGSQFDLRIEQPWHHLVASVRTLGEYRRETFPAENGEEAIDKEAVDDLKGIFEVAARSGNYRPFGNVGVDSEFTAGIPGQVSPARRQMLTSIDAGLMLPKRGVLHEARLSATALRDLSDAFNQEPSTNRTETHWRFGLSGLADFRRQLPVGSIRLLLGARLFLPETEPQPNTLLWAFSERIEYAFPLAGGLNLKTYFEHLSWRTHLANPAPTFADTWLSGGLSLDFARVLRPFAGLF